MKAGQGTGSEGRIAGPDDADTLPSSVASLPAPAPHRRLARVVIRPARPDDLEETTRLERRIWGRLSATLNELQRRLFALPEAFLLAELQQPGQAPRIVGLTNGLLWTRDFPRSFADYEKTLPSSSHNPRGDILYVASLGVHPHLRGRGVGHHLLNETIEFGRRRHLKLARLIANHRSRGLFAQAGFEVVRPLPRLYRQHRDLMPKPVLMELPLA
jgi:ribosomal protein S18 acetylase RimI-like enzyme